MKLVVGLGNPGDKYRNTRHNLGFMVLDALLEKFESVEKTAWEKKSSDIFEKNKALTKELLIAGIKVVLAKPQTYMNLSGEAVVLLLSKYKLRPEALIVIHDDIDLPFGKIRVRFGGAAGGHRGVESVIERIGTDKFLRIRLGIGRPEKISNFKFQISNSQKVEDYVLGEIGSNERGKVRTMVKEVVRIVPLILKHGLEEYMSKYNKAFS